jgi:hypothetical protein
VKFEKRFSVTIGSSSSASFMALWISNGICTDFRNECQELLRATSRPRSRLDLAKQLVGLELE